MTISGAILPEIQHRKYCTTGNLRKPFQHDKKFYFPSLHLYPFRFFVYLMVRLQFANIAPTNFYKIVNPAQLLPYCVQFIVCNDNWSNVAPKYTFVCSNLYFNCHLFLFLLQFTKPQIEHLRTYHRLPSSHSCNL